MATNVWWGYDPRPCDEIAWAAEALRRGAEPEDIDRRYSLCVRAAAAADELAHSIGDALHVPDSYNLERLEHARRVIDEILREVHDELGTVG